MGWFWSSLQLPAGAQIGSVLIRSCSPRQLTTPEPAPVRSCKALCRAVCGRADSESGEQVWSRLRRLTERRSRFCPRVRAHFPKFIEAI